MLWILYVYSIEVRKVNYLKVKVFKIYCKDIYDKKNFKFCLFFYIIIVLLV